MTTAIMDVPVLARTPAVRAPADPALTGDARAHAFSFPSFVRPAGAPGGPEARDVNDALGRYLSRVRVRRVLPHVQGRLLDIGCGSNELVAAYRERAGAADAGASLGVDVHPWPGVDRVVEDTRELPFADGSFDTVTMIAALNHIPYRREALAEVRRLLAPGGRLVVTMIPPGISRLWHALRRPWDADQSERGMGEGEVYGLRRGRVREMVESAGLTVVHEESFMLGINRLTVAGKPTG